METQHPWITGREGTMIEITEEAHEEIFRRQSRELNKLQNELTSWRHATCTHVAGSNSHSQQSDIHGRTSIVWHVLNTNETIGVCTVCQRVFRENDADYDFWRSKKNFNKLSRSESDEPYDENKPEVRRIPLPNDLDDLSDDAIKLLFEGIQAYYRASKNYTKEVQS